MKSTNTKELSVNAKRNNHELMENANIASLTKKEKTALQVIYSHPGKRYVYEAYSKRQPEMARKYLIFVSKNPWTLYFKWDEDRKQFVA